MALRDRLLDRLPRLIRQASRLTEDVRELVVDESIQFAALDYAQPVYSAEELERVFWDAALKRVRRAHEGRYDTVRGGYGRADLAILDTLASGATPEDEVLRRAELRVALEFAARLAPTEQLVWACQHATVAARPPDLRTHVEGARWAARMKVLLGRFQGLLRSLTDTSKVASTEVLNRNFERAFYDECAALRAPNVELDFPGRRGQAARRKTVTSDHSLTDILSEGEQKVIAVADFLAEASFRGGSAPVVFDDPVNSLDHRRLHEMVLRIVALSEQHQVIVFTHNIWFVSELLAQFEGQPRECSLFQVSERSGAKGVLTGGVHPRMDTESKIRGRINDALQAARAAGEDERQHLVDGAYDHVRAWCEIVVEGDLLANVTRRYQPNVAMGNLTRIKAERLGEAIQVIAPIFERACRYIPGHSQPMETLGVRPTLDELEADWEVLQEARRRYAA